MGKGAFSDCRNRNASCWRGCVLWLYNGRGDEDPGRNFICLWNGFGMFVRILSYIWNEEQETADTNSAGRLPGKLSGKPSD